MTSYRAEAYGKLSWILFLHHYTTYYNITIQSTISPYLDNESIGKRTNPQVNYTKAYTTLWSDYDILIAIHKEETKLAERTPRLHPTKHVLGHQDDHTPIHRLPLPAQLNIQADKLATIGLRAITLKKKVAPCSVNPHCTPYHLYHERRHNYYQ